MLCRLPPEDEDDPEDKDDPFDPALDAADNSPPRGGALPAHMLLRLPCKVLQ